MQNIDKADVMSPTVRKKFIKSLFFFCRSSRQLLQQIPKFNNNISLTKEALKDVTQQKNFYSSIRNGELKIGCPKSTPYSSKNAAKIKAILVGGGGVTLGLAARTFLQQSHNKVKCDGNRLAGVIQKTLQQEDGKFDWRRFWSYLEPHLWEFLGAIAGRYKNYLYTMYLIVLLFAL